MATRSLNARTGLTVGPTGIVVLDDQAVATVARVAISGTTDVTLTSTTNPIQIGATATANLVFDSNEIQARNNGAATSLFINELGGNVSLGDATSLITTDGTVRLRGSSYSTALGIRESAAYGGAGPNSNADTVVLENSGNAGISILTPNTSQALIYFGDPESNTSGRIGYSHASDTLTLTAGNTTAFTATSTAIASPLSFDLTGNLNISGDIQGQSGDLRIEAAQTTDGADTGRILLLPSPSASIARGAFVVIGGNESTTPGNIVLAAGDSGGSVQVQGVFSAGNESVFGAATYYNGDNGEIPRVQVHGASQSEAGLGIFSWATGTTSDGRLSFMKTNSGTIGTQGGTALGSGVELGTIVWSGQAGASTTNFSRGATIKAVTAGTFSATSAPTSLIFSTTPSASLIPVDRLTINTAGMTLVGAFTADSITAPTFTGVSTFPSGTATAPSINFTNDADSGFYSSGTGATALVGVALNGTAEFTVTAGRTTANGQLFANSGGLSTTVSSSSGTTLSITAGTVTDTSTAASGTVANRTANNFSIPTYAATNTAVTYTNASTLLVNGAPTAGTNATITNTHAIQVNAGRTYLVGAGTAAIPALAIRDVDTGLFSSATNTLDITTGGTVAASFGSTGNMTLTGAIRTISGTVTVPGISFSGDTNTGFYTDAADTLRVTTGGTLAATFTSAGALTVVGTVTAPSATISGTAAVGVNSTVDGIEIGYRNVPRLSGTGKTLVATDNGKCYATTGTVTVPASVMAAGDVVMIYNNSASTVTLTQGAGLTLRLAGTATTGSRTIDQRGFATIWFNSATEAIVSGNVA